MVYASSLTEAVTGLSTAFTGKLLGPTDPGYETARKVHNGLHRQAADAHRALPRRGRHRRCGEAGARPRARRGRARRRHNVGGRATFDGGVMIDLSPMQGIYVDPKGRTARAQGGVTWNGFNRETQFHGLATTGGVVSTTGIAGLTLGGGLGWLMGKHGLALDNLLSVELVLADGKILTASADDNADLFWALRGGGGNFGVAASLEYRLHPVGPIITGGIIAYPFSEAWDVLRFFRDVTASLPDELMVFGGLIHAPDGSGTKLAAMVVCHCGPPEEGEKAARPIKTFGHPSWTLSGRCRTAR